MRLGQFAAIKEPPKPVRPMGDPLELFKGEHVWKGAFRFYSLPGGLCYPGITTVLAGTKPESSQKALKSWIERVGEEEAHAIKERASTRGTGMHAAAEAFLHGQLDSHVIAPEAMPYWLSLEPVIKELVLKPYLIEGTIWHQRLKVSGSVDLVAHVSWPGYLGGVPAIVDWKTSDKPKDEGWINDYFDQVAGYMAMVNFLYGKPYGGIKHGVVVIAIPDQPAQIFRLCGFRLKMAWQSIQKRIDLFHSLMEENLPERAAEPQIVAPPTSRTSSPVKLRF